MRIAEKRINEPLRYGPAEDHKSLHSQRKKERTVNPLAMPTISCRAAVHPCSRISWWGAGRALEMEQVV